LLTKKINTFKKQVGDNMSSHKRKFTKEDFIKKFNLANGNLYNKIEINEYNGVDEKYKVICNHGESFIHGWALIKPKKYCCQKGYHEKRIPSLTKTLQERKEQIKNIWKDRYILDNARFDPNEKRKIIIECKTHGEFSQWIRSLTGKGVVSEACPTCSTEINKEVFRENAIKNFKPYWGNQASVSKTETRWLDELNIKDRQVFLEDVHYTVDGYNKKTNTVYLYHGRFWHGCPNTYDPEETHPVIGIKMKDLYEKTLFYENKIKEAGYNLVVKWGD
jgi:Zn ribbon nucleic-acid-binding protein